jgi:hypothetical protein
MEQVIQALTRQAVKEREKIDKDDPKANVEYLLELEKAIQIIKTYIALHSLFND